MRQSLSQILDLLIAVLPNMFGIIATWGKWSEMMAVKSPNIMSASIMLENILSIGVIEWLVIPVGCKIKGINELDASESKSSLVGLCLL